MRLRTEHGVVHRPIGLDGAMPSEYRLPNITEAFCTDAIRLEKRDVALFTA